MTAVDARRPIRKKPPMPRTSSGLLMFRRRPTGLEVLLAHPGGPFYVNKDDGAWSIPKGEIKHGEDLLAAAQREFAEEVGFPPSGPFIELHPITQRGGSRRRKGRSSPPSRLADCADSDCTIAPPANSLNSLSEIPALPLICQTPTGKSGIRQAVSAELPVRTKHFPDGVWKIPDDRGSSPAAQV